MALALPRPGRRRKPGSRPSRGRAQVLPLLILLFMAAGALRLGSSIGAAFAQDPAQDHAQPAAPDEPASARPGEPRPLRSSPVSDARLSLEIRERERLVAEREAALQERESLLTAAQTRVAAQIDALQGAEAELAATMAQADRASEDDIARLVSVFQAMRPEQAAAVFTEMDATFAAGFLARMDPQAAAAVLAGMDPVQAYGLSAIVAGRNALVPRE